MTTETGTATPRAAGLGLLTVVLAPLAFGAVSLNVWVPLAWLWICLGVWTLLRRRHRPQPEPLAVASITRLFAAVHVLFAIQLIPLPPDLLRAVSPGSFAAHYLPSLATDRWAPLTASATGTWQAWLFFAGMHGLTVALFGGTEGDRYRRRTLLFWGIVTIGTVLALEGLIQAASAHPFWLYGVFPVAGAGAHESGIFGPYYNRDHYSNLMAIAASVAAGMLANRVPRSGSGASPSIIGAPDFSRILGLAAALSLMLTAGAASGSRGGLAAMGSGLLVGLSSTFVSRPRIALSAALLAIAVLFGTGVPAAVARLADIDFEASRLLVWRDALRLIEFFPIFGCGLGAFAPAYWPYQRVVRFEYWPHAHNEYLQWVLEGGLFGILLALYGLRVAWLAAPRIVRSDDLRPALAGLTAAMVHAVVDCSLRIPANAAWTGLLLCCLVLGPSSSRPWVPARQRL